MLWECLCGLVMAERRVGDAPYLWWTSVVGPTVSPPQHKDISGPGGAGQRAAPPPHFRSSHGACVQPAALTATAWEGGPPAVGRRELRCVAEAPAGTRLEESRVFAFFSLGKCLLGLCGVLESCFFLLTLHCLQIWT